MATTSKQVRGLIGNVADTLTHAKDGTWTARRGFFYTGGKTAKDFAARIVDCLGSDAAILGMGTVMKPFRGNASTKASSHWWVTFRVAGELTPNCLLDGLAKEGDAPG